MTDTSRDLYEKCIEQASQSVPEDERPQPKVGAVLIRGKQVKAAHRGEISPGDHAEFTLLERKLGSVNFHRGRRDAKLYVTLEPCTDRKKHEPCAVRVIKRGIKNVCVGMLDPNPSIYGNGVWHLRRAGVNIEYFPRQYRERIKRDNTEFIEHQIRSFDLNNFTRDFPKLFIDPDQPYLTVAYALFRIYAGNTVIFFNTKLRMFLDPHEFQAWWVHGIFENSRLENIYILANKEDLGEAKNSAIKEVIIDELENLVRPLATCVKSIKDAPFTGIFFMDDRNGKKRIDFGMFLLPIPHADEKRVMLVVGRGGGYDGILDAICQEICEDWYLGRVQNCDSILEFFEGGEQSCVEKDSSFPW